ncbi:hypothetical protein FKM82_030549 [Ascaphus truei]
MEDEMSVVAVEELEEEKEAGEKDTTCCGESEEQGMEEQLGKDETIEEDNDEKTQKIKERLAEIEISTDDQSNEPKKWNLRRNRPLLDFVTMEELNAMDDYDSEDDNDWRPTAGKKKGKTTSIGEGSDGDEDEEEDGSEEEENNAGNDEVNGSSSSDEGKKKIKFPSRNSADDEELTNDSLTLSQSKSNEVEMGRADKRNRWAQEKHMKQAPLLTSALGGGYEQRGEGKEDSLILEKSEKWSSQKMDHILICCVCLGDNSEDADEIIQCDNCGITVHEGNFSFLLFYCQFSLFSIQCI